MSPLTLDSIEQELLKLADQDWWADGELEEAIRALARRIGVQVEADKLARAA